jgi:Ion channel
VAGRGPRPDPRSIPPAAGEFAAFAEQAGVESSRQRYGMLLLALGITFFFEGVSEPGDGQRAIGTALVGAALMLALNAAEISRRRMRLAAALVLVIAVAVLIAALAGMSTTVAGIAAIANGLLIALAPVAVVLGVLRNLRATREVTVTTVAGVLCLYLLIGLFFSFVYSAIQYLGNGAFFTNGDAATSAHSVYFSFVTMTTVGYGDFTARTNLGHTLAVAEALLGQIYLVTVVATIIGRLVPRRVHLGDG